jgi:RNA polymerase sigma-70 factor
VEQLRGPRRSIRMVASCPAASDRPLTERESLARLLDGEEPAFRDALTTSLDELELCDRNMLRFHYFHGLNVDQLASVSCSHRGAVVRQLARIRERLLRNTRRALAVRLRLDRRQLDGLLEVVRGRLDLALTRILRTSGDSAAGCPRSLP